MWRLAVAAAVAAVLGAREVATLDSSDILGTKVWLDQHLFNMTLKTATLDNGVKGWKMDPQKAKENGLDIEWPPPQLPTLCFLGLGPSSLEYLVTIARLFPELHIVLMEADDPEYLEAMNDLLGEELNGRVELGHVEQFAEARGSARRACNSISWSVDTPRFSFYRYRELFYSSPYVLALFNVFGCTVDTRTPEVDSYNCEYLYSNFQATLCGRINEDRQAEWHGEEYFFPLVDAGCSDNLCMCHAHSDAYLDFHLEQLCRVNEPPRFMGQWGQDFFLYHNIFVKNEKPKKGLYVDIGASHPFHLSNTGFFDQCLEWRGICVEPNPRSRPILQALRSCQVVTGCAWANKTTLRFSNGMELAARTDNMTLLPSTPYEMDLNTSWEETFFEATCAPLHDVLLAALPGALGVKPKDFFDGLQSGSSLPTIDLLSVDAEGAEIEIFKDFPFKLWDIRVIVAETSRRTNMAIDGLLLPYGFLKVAQLGKDAVYVHHRSIASLPSNGPLLPSKIAWNEPGTDADTIEYLRFQRLFGVEGDLDVDVGDQRLQNETELLRQAERLDADHNRTRAKVLEAAKEASVGGHLSEEAKSATSQPWIQEILRMPKVKVALSLVLDDEDEFAKMVKSDAALKEKLASLVEVGILRHEGALSKAGLSLATATEL
eukprot:gnl/TRDRNA2_/TRDRNA2_85015_c0_seq1.p1 gnl/TRDRNA2_/TRDRNA2_85015_c0~~gnl/TRDRNA2_/TRDRNA2_85015_c0_seq1.p1  ORF type:complete len:659 (-),score=110.96 gnl/TRDRNA2_/TRDRNA2_85015_c0_seq1:42-2018(-)